MALQTSAQSISVRMHGVRSPTMPSDKQAPRARGTCLCAGNAFLDAPGHGFPVHPAQVGGVGGEHVIGGSGHSASPQSSGRRHRAAPSRSTPAGYHRAACRKRRSRSRFTRASRPLEQALSPIVRRISDRAPDGPGRPGSAQEAQPDLAVGVVCWCPPGAHRLPGSEFQASADHRQGRVRGRRRAGRGRGRGRGSPWRCCQRSSAGSRVCRAASRSSSLPAPVSMTAIPAVACGTKTLRSRRGRPPPRAGRTRSQPVMSATRSASRWRGSGLGW